MSFFIVTMTHPDGAGWNKNLAAHVKYLQALVETGTLRASGPLKGLPLRAGFLIMSAFSREEVEAVVSQVPFDLE